MFTHHVVNKHVCDTYLYNTSLLWTSCRRHDVVNYYCCHTTDVQNKQKKKAKTKTKKHKCEHHLFPFSRTVSVMTAALIYLYTIISHTLSLACSLAHSLTDCLLFKMQNNSSSNNNNNHHHHYHSHHYHCYAQ